MKKCSRCKQIKSLEEYYNNSDTNDGKHLICKLCDTLRQSVYSRLLRMEFVLAYGGKCQCCGETEIDLLTIEHIKNSGYRLVRSSNSKEVIKELKRLKWPKGGHTVLCYNCNCSTKMRNPCVHTQEYEMYEKKFESLFTDNEKRKYNTLKHKLRIMSYKVSKVA